MNPTPATLYLKLYLIGLESKVITYQYPLKTLGEIDATTLSYLNVYDFFYDRKESITGNIRHKKEKYEIEIAPTDIELMDIYLKKGDKKIAILFQRLQRKNQEYDLLEVVKNELFRGKIFTLYNADKINCQNPEYETVFDGASHLFLEHLELGLFKPIELAAFFEQLREKKRFPALIRFILSNNSKPEDIPIRENLSRKDKNEINDFIRERKCRTPYKDD